MPAIWGTYKELNSLSMVCQTSLLTITPHETDPIVPLNSLYDYKIHFPERLQKALKTVLC